jgi:hypothetical protein
MPPAGKLFADMDTSSGNRGIAFANKKGRVWRGLVELLLLERCPASYFGWFEEGAFGVVADGALGAAGFVEAGLAGGAGTPDCTL